MKLSLLDCTLRDGGYYNAWDFSFELIADYLGAMKAGGINIVELGFRFLRNKGFKGACAYTTDDFLRGISIPHGLTVGVMVNGSDLYTEIGCEAALDRLFPQPASASPVDLVRFACHYHELPQVFEASRWLANRGYRVGINLMQISDRSQDEVETLGKMAMGWPVEVLYFADSMGGMNPDDVSRIVGWLRENWSGPLGIHTHDNMGLGLSNSLRAVAEGVTWLDSTVTGMGRGPGNARTEELLIEAEGLTGRIPNLVPLMALIRKHFGPMKERYGWGTNPYYFLAGKYGIHPTYIQEMLGDARYDEEDVLAVIEHLRVEGGKSFNLNTLDAARHFYRGEPKGQWAPRGRLEGRDVLLLGAGPGVLRHREALERYIRARKPVVLALNTQTGIDPELIELRAACHPIRLLADAERHTALPHPLITPYSMLPENVRASLADKKVLDFGLNVQAETFVFGETYCSAPTSLVVAYALAVVTSGKARRMLMAGFDGYGADDPRTQEMQRLFERYQAAKESLPITAITPTRYGLHMESVYAL